MTTVRLDILAAAAALREFTVPELVAYTGANPNTVRQVLHRERHRRGLFERITPPSATAGSQQAVVWRLINPAAVMDELEAEASEVAELGRQTRASRQDEATTTETMQAEALLASAEDAVERSYSTADSAERGMLAEIAENFLQSTNPDVAMAAEASPPNWWEIPSGASGDAATRQRARRIAAFAAISTRCAKGLPIDTEQLASAAEEIARSDKLISQDEIREWVRRIVSATDCTASHLPPIAVLTPADQSPADMFPAIAEKWRRVSVSAEYAHFIYAIWVQQWAESLFAASLIPGLVVLHNETPEANEILDEVLGASGSLFRSAAVVIASTSDDLGVVERVSLKGGTFYPIRETSEGLVETVNRSVRRAVGATPYQLVGRSAGYEMSVGRHRTRSDGGVLVLGGDGFCGWPTSLYLSDRGHDITIVDNLSRRKIDVELEVESLTPIRPIGERISVWREVSGRDIGFINLDLATEYDRLVAVLLDLRPDAIVHFAEQRAAPYSMRTTAAKRYTVDNNVRATHNLLTALVATGIDATLVHLGTMGIYGYGWSGSAPVPEGYLTVKVETPDGELEREILHPANPESVYHLTKTLDQLMFSFYTENDHLRITDLHQGIVWGTQTAQTSRDGRLINRFDYDGDYGTVLNRFLMQAAIGHPLTVHGGGFQTRAFIHIRDTVRCIEIALANPPPVGSRPLVLNQVTETHRIIDLAKMVADVADVDIAYLPNPRRETEDNDLNVRNDQFLALGLEPTTLSDGLLEEGREIAARYRHRVDLTKIISRSVWRAGMETAEDLVTELGHPTPQLFGIR